MVDHNTETSTDISKPVMQTDFLVCGRCQRKFTLSSLQAFIQHKLFDCQGVSLEGMECQSCPEKFQTPWRLIRHAQNTHSLKIFLEEGPYGEGISSVNDDLVDQERLGDLGIQLPENTSQISMREDAQVISNIEDTTDGRTLPVILKPSTELCEQQTVVSPHVSTHRIVTGISNVTTQATPQVLFNSSSANVVAPVQVVAIKPVNTVAKDPTTTLSTTCSPSSNNCVLMPVGEKPNNRHPVLRATSGGVEKVLPVSLGVGSRLQSVLRTPGAHSISVLQPIKLPPGALLGTSLCMNNASQPSMTFTMLPLGLPQSQAKTSLVQIQKAAGRMASLQKAEDNADSNSQLVLPVTFHVSTTSDIAGASTVLPHLAEDSSCPPSRDGAWMIPKEDLAATSGFRATAVASELATLQDSSPQIQVVTQSSSVQTVSECATVTESSKHDNLALACPCPCCKVGKCMRGIEKLGLKESDGNPCPCGPIIPSVSSPKVLQNSAVPCSDATTQSDLKRCKRKDSKGIQKEEAVCTDNLICCCDNQDCGVTIMPGTHEGLKKCCNAVVPKKRKRHMETKHQIKKHRAAAAAAAEPSFSAEPNTIYINIQSTPAIPQGSSSVAGELRLNAPVGTQGAITVNTSTAGLTSNSSTMDVNPSSLTLSIPVVSYTRQGSCSAGNCTRPGGVNNTDCGCGCCPGPRKLQYTSLRDKKLKTSRRLSGSSLEAQKEFLVAQAMKQGAMDLAAGVKTEALNGRVDGDQTTNERLLGQRKMLRPTMRANVVGKKRRYPTSRPFKCDQCDHAFNQRIHLKKHLSKHTGIKPFKCEQCDYSTVERSHLKVHIRVHTGEKPYKCSCCEYATAQNSTLKIHLKRHHGDGGGDDGGGDDGSSGSHAPFSCPVCGLEFEDEAPLLQHQLQHPPATNAGGGDDVTASKSASAEAKREGGAVEERTKGSGKGPTGMPTLTVSL